MTQVEQMEKYLRERFGITDRRQVAGRLKTCPKINMALFTGEESDPDDDSRSPQKCRA